MVTYVPVPIALICLSLIKPFASISSIFIPLLMIGAVTSASVFEVKIFLRSASRGKISAVVNDLEKLVVGGLTVLAPVVAYSAVFLKSFDHVLSVLAMGGTVLAELAVAFFILGLNGRISRNK